jgi:crossover junction endodeoxyribonuclease RuvC
MAIIHIELSNIIEKYSPTCAAIEKIFFSKNTKTALDVAKVTGAVMLTIWQYRLDMTEYTPNQVKMALTGFGMATKEQMQTMIKTVFKLSTVPKPDDAADALAIALCHSFSMPAFSARSRYV